VVASTSSTTDAGSGADTVAPPPHADAGVDAADAAKHDSGSVSDSGGPVQPLGVSGSWSLIFDDEFEESSLDTSTWAPYWFANGDQQNGTTMLSSNVAISGGNLELTLTSSGTGGLVSTNPNGGASPGFQFTYGFLEARMYLPASGTKIANWPAWWADGQDWPTDGEIDVLEGLGGSAAYHFHDPSGGPGASVPGNYTGWHVFGADWQPGSVTYYYDGVAVGSITSGITSAPMYLILENSAGSYGGPAVLPATVLVDYARVWQSP
jgi:beta-glucanase (GH16 family)